MEKEEIKIFSYYDRLRGNRTNIKGLKKIPFSLLKSLGAWLHVVSIPTAGTNKIKALRMWLP
ncbi:MAG: hypothetical protein HGB11_07695 [Chlorobiales bacterium]|nr:hypothetical protein [Chlorobiales bacterium]